MTNKTKALGRRIIGALKNENVIVIIHPSLGSIHLTNAKTGKSFALVQFHGDIYELVTATETKWYYFGELIAAIKSDSRYPAPKERKPRMQVKTHGAPKYVGISMGSFKPGNVALDF